MHFSEYTLHSLDLYSILNIKNGKLSRGILKENTDCLFKKGKQPKNVHILNIRRTCFLFLLFIGGLSDMKTNFSFPNTVSKK